MYWNVEPQHWIEAGVFSFLQFFGSDMLTVAGSWSARSHGFRFFSITLISNPASDQTPLHPLPTGHRALWKSTISNSLTHSKTSSFWRAELKQEKQVTETTVHVTLTGWDKSRQLIILFCPFLYRISLWEHRGKSEVDHWLPITSAPALLYAACLQCLDGFSQLSSRVCWRWALLRVSLCDWSKVNE